jgi:hypothetical protein
MTGSIRPMLWMTAACAAAWGVVALVASSTTSLTVLCGMAAPLLTTVATWWMVDQTFRHAPERLTGTMVAAFGGKMLFFGAYLAVMLKGLRLPAVPFIASFTMTFVGLHMTEALLFRRLFSSPRPGDPASVSPR